MKIQQTKLHEGLMKMITRLIFFFFPFRENNEMEVHKAKRCEGSNKKRKKGSTKAK